MIRLKELREERKLNMRQVAKALEIPYTTYISYEKGDREPNSEMLICLADFFNCSIDFLIGRSDERVDEAVIGRANAIEPDILAFYGNIYEAQKVQTEFDTKPISRHTLIADFEIEMIKKYRSLDRYGKTAVDELINTEYKRVTDHYPNTAEYIALRFDDCPVSAGTGDILDDYEHWETVLVPLTPESRKADFILRVDGDSMESKFHDGDLVLVRKQEIIEQGEIGIFSVDGKGYIKKLGKNVLISLNKKYPEIPLNNESRCFGKVLGVTNIVSDI